MISPQMFEEFMLQYQRPIMTKFGLVSYACCEDVTTKIDALRTIPNLRRIGIPPICDVGRCAEQIQHDYVFAWKPNPAMVCCGFDADDAGENAARLMIARHPEIQRLRPAAHDWNDDLRSRRAAPAAQ